MPTRTHGGPSLKRDCQFGAQVERTGPGTPNAVEATLLLAATGGLDLEFCATGDRSRVERAIEALAEFVEWWVTSTR